MFGCSADGLTIDRIHERALVPQRLLPVILTLAVDLLDIGILGALNSEGIGFLEHQFRHEFGLRDDLNIWIIPIKESTAGRRDLDDLSQSGVIHRIRGAHRSIMFLLTSP